MNEPQADTADADSGSMPRDFGWRYLVWLAWTNKLTLLFIAQSAILEYTADEDLPKAVFHHCMTAVNIIGIVLAQVSRKQGAIAPPRKDRA